MQVTVNHNFFGTITYTESFWTGKKEIYFGQFPLVKQSKNTYLMPGGDPNAVVTVKGNFLTGVSLVLGSETIRLTPAPKWYEWVLALLPLIFICVWGNSVPLCMIFPIVGGALGGAIGGLAFVFGLLFMKKTERIAYKLLIGLGIFVAAVLSCYALAIAIIGTMI